MLRLGKLTVSRALPQYRAEHDKRVKQTVPRKATVSERVLGIRNEHVISAQNITRQLSCTILELREN